MNKKELMNEVYECNRAISVLLSKDRSPLGNRSSASKVIGILSRAEGEVHPTDICTELGVTTPRITTILNAMEEDGLIERSMSADDRRKVVVKLTDKGGKISESARKRDLECFEKVYNKIGTEDMEAVLRYLNAYLDVVKELGTVKKEI